METCKDANIWYSMYSINFILPPGGAFILPKAALSGVGATFTKGSVAILPPFNCDLGASFCSPVLDLVFSLLYLPLPSFISLFLWCASFSNFLRQTVGGKFIYLFVCLKMFVFIFMFFNFARNCILGCHFSPYSIVEDIILSTSNF